MHTRTNPSGFVSLIRRLPYLFIFIFIFSSLSSACSGDVTATDRRCDKCPKKCLLNKSGEGKCVNCLDNSQCQSKIQPTRVCNSSNICICGSNKDCPKGRHCDADKGCVECLEKSHCKDSSKPFCNFNACSECEPKSIGSCSPKDSKACAQGTHTCRINGTWSDCKDWKVCKAWEKCTKEQCVPDCSEKACQAGTLKCSTASSTIPGKYLVCTKSAHGCFEFGGAEKSCAPKEFCDKGECKPYKCPKALCKIGEHRCAGTSKQQSCIRNKLGCLEWESKSTNCTKGLSCRPSLGKCAKCDPKVKKSCYEGKVGTSGVADCKKGIQICLDDGSGYGSCNGQVKPNKESCNGKDDDCNGKVDDPFRIDVPCSKGVGACIRIGKRICKQDGSDAQCSVQAGTKSKEVCNGKDDDCNGKVDDQLTPPKCKKQQGVCKGSVQKCSGTKGWQACTTSEYTKGNPSYQPTEKKCDGKDNDCDGQADEGFINLRKVCIGGQGACKKAGTYICKSDGTGTVCSEKGSSPSKELCNGKDDNCDGKTDEGFQINGICKVGTGICIRTGKNICKSDGTGTQCSATPSSKKKEICNGLDDDCNGAIDELLTAPKCQKQVGSCKGSTKKCGGTKGWQICIPSEYAKGNPNYQPIEKKCDGKDNDCDGQTDEGYALLDKACASGMGKCKRIGKYICNSAKNGLICNAKAGTSTPESCNGEDDNCNGKVDEGLSQSCYSGSSGTDGVGACKKGLQACTGGNWGTCIGEVKPLSKEVCGNKKDDNCNGKTDEGCDWVLTAGGSSKFSSGGANIIVTASVAGPNNNIYYTGYFQGTATFGRNVLNSKGKEDIFIAKMDEKGRFLWAQQAGGSKKDQATAIAISPKGDVFVTGNYEGKALFGSTSLTQSSNIFVVKLDSVGNFLWAVTPIGGNLIKSTGIAYSRKNDKLFITGYLHGNVLFGIHSARGFTDIFLSELDPKSGSFKNVLIAGGDRQNYSRAITADNKGNLYLAGRFSGLARFGSLSLKGYVDAFVVKYSTISKKFVWAVKAGSNSFDEAFVITSDDNGNLAVSGYIGGKATFGGFSINTKGSKDIFVARVTPQGRFMWVVSAGGRFDDLPHGITMDSNQNIYVTGFYDRAPMIVGNKVLAPYGVSDIFIIKYTSSGSLAWAKRAGGQHFDSGQAITINQDGKLFASGFFYGGATFTPFTLASQSPNHKDLYIARMDSKTGTYVWVTSAGASTGDEGQGITVGAKGQTWVAGTFGGNGTFGSTNLFSQGAGDIFLAEIDSAGKIKWVKRAGGSGDDLVTDLTSNNSKMLYLTGGFTFKAKFGTLTLSSAGSYDTFIAAYDTLKKQFSWVVRAGGTKRDIATSIVYNTSNQNIYALGNFNGTATFGSTKLVSQGKQELFLAQLSLSRRQYVWATKLSATGPIKASKFAEGPKGKLYIAANYSGTAKVGANSHRSQGLGDAFFAQFDPSTRQFKWSKNFGGSQNDKITGIAVDSSGKVYLTGCFEGSITVNGKSFKSKGISDVFIAKYDPNIQKFSWIITGGSNGDDCGTDIGITKKQELFISGNYQSSFLISGRSIKSKGQQDIFVMKFDTNGKVLGIKSAGGSKQENSSRIFAHSTGLYTTGSFSKSAIFPTGKVTAKGGLDAFFWKISKF